MKNTIVVCGHGPGISHAVARRFGEEGLAVALIARNKERVTAAAAALKAAGIEAQAFACDLGDAAATKAAVKAARAALGPIQIVHYNAYTSGGGDLLTAKPEELNTVFNVSVQGLIAATQEALPDLKSSKGALLVTGGGFAFYDPNVDGMAVQYGAMGLAIGKAAQHKAVGMLHLKLKPEGVYVGEVVVLGSVKGTAFDSGHATIEPSAVAEKFWQMYQAKSEMTANFS